MYPTLTEVLDLPVLRAAVPRVRAGSAGLAVPVRWVHVSEQRDPTGTLTGGELVLSTGIALADPATDPQAYVARLRDVGAVGLVVELGEHVPTLPDGLVQAARAADLPLVELRRSVRFVEVTEVVHARILDEQATRMRFTQRVHDSFRTLAVEDGSTARVLAEAASLSGQPVVLEDLGHRALSTAAADAAPGALLEDWPARSRQVPMTASTTTAGPEGWTTTPVGVRARAWGRLVVPRRVVGEDAQETLRLVLEQAAHALTVRRVLADDPVAPGLEAEEELLRDLLRASRLDEPSLRARARALGLPRGGVLSAVVVGSAPGEDPRELATVWATAARRAGVPSLVGRLAADRVGLVLSCPTAEAERATVDRVAELVPAGPGSVVGAAGPVAAFAELRDALAEASSVVDVGASPEPEPEPGPGAGRVRRSADLGVRGLLWQLRGDGRLAAFVDAELGPVLALPEPARGSVLRSLLAYLDSGGRMTAFAHASGLSRQAAYDRLERMRTLLGARLADPRARLSLHLALLALDVGGSPATSAAAGGTDSAA